MTNDLNPDNPIFSEYYQTRFQPTFIDQIRKREGGQIIIDINTPDSGSVKFSGLYSSTETNIGTYFRNYAGIGGGTWDYNFQFQEFGISTVNASLQGKNYLPWFDVDWNVSYAHSKGTNPYDFQLIFNEVGGGGGIGVGKPTYDPQRFIQTAVNNYTVAQCSSSTYNKQENFDKEMTAFLVLSKKYTIGTIFSGELKGGGKYKERSRWVNQEQFINNDQLHPFFTDGINTEAFIESRFGDFYLNRRAGVASLSDFVDEPAVSRNLLGKYKMNPIINLSTIRQWYAFIKSSYFGGNAAFVSNATARINSYSMSEAVSSAFIMNTLHIGQSVILMTGLRVEDEKDKYFGNYGVGLSVIGLQTTGTIKDTATRFNETIWLPNAQLVIRPTDFLTVRLAGYRALARPDYNMRLPRFSTANQQPVPITLGNTNIRNTKAWNFEVNTQIYNNAIGLISISAFYKKIDDLYHIMTNVNINRGTDPTYNDSVLTSIGITWQKTGVFKTIMDANPTSTYTLPYNSNSPSYAWGFEFEHQTNFGFLSNNLANLTLSYNISISRSETHIIVSDQIQPYFLKFTNRWVWDKQSGLDNLARWQKRQSENQPNLFGNFALGYDIGRFSTRVSVFYQDESVQTYSFDGQSDLHTKSFTKWDLAFKYQLTQVVNLFLNIDNLTNLVETTSQINTFTGWDLLRSELSYGMTAELGVRLSL